MMNYISGRNIEKAILQNILDADTSEFVAVYGRRRTGKTYLVKNFFDKQICFHVTGVQNGGIKTQLQNFTNELGLRKKQIIAQPTSWLQAFQLLRDHLSKLPKKGKKVVFFDELPWTHTQRSGCLQALAHFWNNWAAWEKNIILVISGSSTSWIVKKIFNDRGGLHNRVTKRIKLQPFTLYEVEQYLQWKKINLDQYQIIQLYMAMGGIPFYLNELKRGESATQCIQRACFSNEGLLKDEFDNLYKALFEKADKHILIIKALAQNNYGLTRLAILQKTKLPNAGSSTRLLTDLEESGFIKYVVPLGIAKSKGKYVLTDFYSRFYLKFIVGSKNVNWISIVESPKWRAWSGIAFEIICLTHIIQIKKALGIGGIEAASYTLLLKNKDAKPSAQIDLVIDRKDKSINLCEIKFSEKEYALTKQDKEKMQNKIYEIKDQLKSRKTIFPTMITTYGCTKNSNYLGLITNEVVMSDLFTTI